MRLIDLLETDAERAARCVVDLEKQLDDLTVRDLTNLFPFIQGKQKVKNTFMSLAVLETLKIRRFARIGEPHKSTRYNG